MRIIEIRKQTKQAEGAFSRSVSQPRSFADSRLRFGGRGVSPDFYSRRRTYDGSALGTDLSTAHYDGGVTLSRNFDDP